MDINNKTVIISGGASGLGAATAKRFANLGAKVALLDLNEQALKALAEEISGLALPCDVRSSEQIEQAMESAKQAFGLADICINCAGIAPGARIVGKQGPMALEEFTRAIEINLIGTFNVMRFAASQMFQQKEGQERGVIINTASVAAFDGQIGQAAYSASKGGVVAMTLPAAREFAKFAIRVNTIAPGIMQTPMMAGMSQAVQDSLADNIPFPNRLGKPEEFAHLAQHIVENPYINGETIRLDAAVRMAAK